MIPLIVLGLPIFDTALVSLSRLRRGKNPLTTPGHDHVSHRLVSWGFSHRQAVLVVYVICSLLGLAGFMVSRAEPGDAYRIGVALLVIACGALILMEADYIRRATARAS
jgi:UDP-GlcNAc:undecaprenyl-phosphate GlcNAc-1-phosphate transferase